MASTLQNGNIEIMLRALEQVQDAVFLTDSRGYLLYVNAAAVKLTGHSELELLHKNVTDFDLKPSARHWDTIFLHLRKRNDMTLHFNLQRSDGSSVPIEINASYVKLDDSEYAVGIARDVSRQSKQMALNALQRKLSEIIGEEDLKNVLRYGLDQAEKLTQSNIGFFHFVENSEQSISLQVWSTNTQQHMCFAQADAHYPVADAGIWVKSIFSKQPYVCNDYAAHPHKRGYPSGHAELHRFATVPLLQQGEVVAIMGVGEKACDYDDEDISLLESAIEIIYGAYQRHQAEKKIGYMAYHDSLTGLPNRHLLMASLNRAIARYKRTQESFAVCYLDIEGFKQVNDLYDHQLGDKILKALATRFTEVLREVDTVARLGGDEFVFIFSNIKTLSECELALKRIQQVVMLPFDIKGQRVHLSSYMGATLYPLDKAEAEDLLRHSANSTYQAKSNRKCAFNIYDPQTAEQKQHHQNRVEEFSHALLGDELRLYLQPKIDLNTLAVIGFEGLIRWQHPGEGLLTPAHFLPALHGTVQEIMLGEWVVEQAIKQLQMWQAAGLNLSLSINISPKQIQRKSFREFVLSILEKTPSGIAEHLEIELLEDSDVEDGHETAENMHALKSQGVKFLLDDFGTGYASLAHFYDLPFDVLKIDQDFVKQMLDRNDNLDIVEGVLKLSEAIQRPVVAEGVESIEIGFMLMKMGCHYAQGYGIAKPMPMEAVTGWLESWNGVNPWHDLQAELQDENHRYDLGVAIFSHRWWVRAIKLHLQSATEEASLNGVAAMPELDESRCQFFRWYRGIGLSRYSEQPGYAFLQGGHHELHELAKAVKACADIGDYEQAWHIFARLQRLSEELINTLKKLEQGY